MSNSKLDKFKQATANSFEDLYLDNKASDNSIQQPKQESVEIPQRKEVNTSDEVKTRKEQNKMLSFRIPLDIIDKINKYSYIARQKKQDVIILAFEKFFDSKESKEILEEYDKLTEVK